MMIAECLSTKAHNLEGAKGAYTVEYSVCITRNLCINTGRLCIIQKYGVCFNRIGILSL